MTLDDLTLYARDDEMDEFGDTGGYGESLEQDYEEEEEEESGTPEIGEGEPGPPRSMPTTPTPMGGGGGGGGTGAPKPAAKKKAPARKAAKKFFAAYRATRDPMEIARRGEEFDGAPAYELYYVGAEETELQLEGTLGGERKAAGKRSKNRHNPWDQVRERHFDLSKPRRLSLRLFLFCRTAGRDHR